MTYLVRSRRNLVWQNARDSVRMNLFRWPVTDEVNEQAVKLSKEYRLAYFLCLRLTTPSIHFTSKCCHIRLTNWFSMIHLHIDQIVNWRVFAELKLFELCLMSAWIDGDFPCWMGMGWCWISLKMESIGDCLEVWAVLNPIHFEVWVGKGVSQMLHVQTTVWKISDQVWLCHDGLKRWGLA